MVGWEVPEPSCTKSDEQLLEEPRSDATALQPGAALAVFADLRGGVRLGADRAGAPHRRAERIGIRVAHQLLDEIHSQATLDRFASDQILPFTALTAA